MERKRNAFIFIQITLQTGILPDNLEIPELISNLSKYVNKDWIKTFADIN